MSFDLKPWLEDKPFEIDAWTAALGVQSLAANTIVEIIAELSKTLAKLSPAALEAWKAQQEMLLATAQWVRAGTNKRADIAIERGAESEFGKALASTAVLCDAKIRCLIADNARTAPKPELE